MYLGTDVLVFMHKIVFHKKLMKIKIACLYRVNYRGVDLKNDVIKTFAGDQLVPSLTKD